MRVTPTVSCVLALLASSVSVSAAPAKAPPFYMQRIYEYDTCDPKVWTAYLKGWKENPGSCDEVWFCTPFVNLPLDYHRKIAASQARAARQLREMGIEPGLEIGTCIGHGDQCLVLPPDCRETHRDWGGWVGPQGIEDQHCNCPRDPRFAAHLEEMGRIYASYHPSSIWFDDDLRLLNHRPATDNTLATCGCFCDRCLSLFSRETGCSWTRGGLAAELRGGNAELHRTWTAFCIRGLVDIVSRVSRAVHIVSPETRICSQHGLLLCEEAQTEIYRAMYEATGNKVGGRFGGGAYRDHDPHEQIEKAYEEMRQRGCLQKVSDIIFQTCPEIESWPRTFGCRTAHGVILEALEAIALGCDSVSLFVMNPARDPVEWYVDEFFVSLARNRACLKGLVEAGKGTVPAGIFVDGTPKWTEACAGLALVSGYGKAYGRLPDLLRSADGAELDIRTASAGDVRAWYARADELSGGRFPVLPERAVQAFVVPRVTESGVLKAVALVNTTIDRMKPLKLRLRGVVPSVGKARWHALESEPVDLAVERVGTDAFVTIPGLAAWNGGWLDVSAAGKGLTQ